MSHRTWWIGGALLLPCAVGFAMVSYPPREVVTVMGADAWIETAPSFLTATVMLAIMVMCLQRRVMWSVVGSVFGAAVGVWSLAWLCIDPHGATVTPGIDLLSSHVTGLLIVMLVCGFGSAALLVREPSLRAPAERPSRIRAWQVAVVTVAVTQLIDQLTFLYQALTQGGASTGTLTTAWMIAVLWLGMGLTAWAGGWRRAPVVALMLAAVAVLTMIGGASGPLDWVTSMAQFYPWLPLALLGTTVFHLVTFPADGGGDETLSRRRDGRSSVISG